MLPSVVKVTPVVPYPPPEVNTLKLPVACVASTVVALGKEMVAFRMEAVPVVAPRVKVVAAPPTERLVALVLNKVAVA